MFQMATFVYKKVMLHNVCFISLTQRYNPDILGTSNNEIPHFSLHKALKAEKLQM